MAVTVNGQHMTPAEVLQLIMHRERHDVLLEAFKKLWLKSPNKRFGQLVSEIMDEEGDYWEVMEISDERYIEKIKEMSGT